MNKDLRHMLLVEIETDTNLMKDNLKRAEMLTFGEMFLEELSENMTLDSFQLDEKYGTYDYQMWREFLSIPAVSKYKDIVLAETIMNKANVDIMLGNKPKDALIVRDRMRQQLSGADNSRITVLRMPPKKRYKNED